MENSIPQNLSFTGGTRPTITILIPCHNEEKMIGKSIQACLNQSRPADTVLVVDDGSTDNSVRIIETFGDKIKLVKIIKNTGNKSYVQQIGLTHINTDVFISTDADSQLDRHFVKYIEKEFFDPGVIAAAGYVISTKHNWLTALREIEYFVGQEVHKTAQANINYLYVIPGCASAFRTEIFRKNIAFDHDTVTEDLDFTFKLHLKKYRISFQKKAIVRTQDPADLDSYINQLRRWYGGGWQNLLKHRQAAAAIPACAFELSMVFVEGMLFAASLVILPFVSLKAFTAMTVTYLITMVALGILAAICRRRADLAFYSPLYLILSILNSYVFCEQFFKEFLRREHNLVWFTPKRRYTPTNNMQNISLLSFFVHLSINIFFGIKKRIFRAAPQITFTLKTPRRNATLSFLLVSAIIGINMAQFGNTLQMNTNTDSGYRQLADLLESQSVLAQVIFSPYAKPMPVGAETKKNAYRHLSYARPAHSKQTQAADSAVNNAHQKTRSTLVIPGDTLRTALKRIVVDYVGDDPCANLTEAGTDYCHRLLEKKLNTTVTELLTRNGFTSGTQSAVIWPGQTVLLDISGTIRIEAASAAT